jgi:phenylalanine-4-hydroxylase
MNEAVGRAVNRTKTEEGIEFLARTFWFTLEFGVVMEDRVPKAYGAGLLSSAGELGQFHERDLRPMDFKVMGRTDYDVTKYQPILFYADSFDDLQKRMNEFHDNWTDDFLNNL